MSTYRSPSRRFATEIPFIALLKLIAIAAVAVEEYKRTYTNKDAWKIAR